MENIIRRQTGSGYGRINMAVRLTGTISAYCGRSTAVLTVLPMQSAGVLRKDGNQKNKYSHTTSTHFLACYLISLRPGGRGNVNTNTKKNSTSRAADLQQRTYGSFIFFRARSAVFGRTGPNSAGNGPRDDQR